MAGLIGCLYVLLSIVVIIMLLIKRNHDQIKKRGLLLMVSSIFFTGSTVLITLLRIAIGRNIFPCFLYMFANIVFNLTIVGILVLRSYRFLGMLMFSRLKSTRTFASSSKAILYMNRLRKYLALIALVVMLFAHISYWLVLLGVAAAFNDNYFTAYGCKVNLMVVLCGVAPVCFYCAAEILFLIMVVVFKMKDTLGIVVQLVVTIFIYVVISVAFIIAQVVKEYNEKVEPHFPALWFLSFGLIFDNICNTVVPCINTFDFSNLRRAFLPSHEPLLSDDIYAALEDEKIRSNLKDFATRSLSVEDILCWEDIQEYKAIEQKEDKILKADEIVRTYLAANCPMEVNVPMAQKIIKNINEHIEQATSNTDPSQDEHLYDLVFQKLEFLVLTNMADVFSRFLVEVNSKK
ncbi:hypothetical protein AKO1_010587 [Acrasis kona]|uniref:RGS domain-containing protein n=1 Tax=Acrasis kona TaxID=1008807 RepID=A0AAW2YXS2_9EUKA